jgi:hypothetical protein
MMLQHIINAQSLIAVGNGADTIRDYYVQK